jgi:hypothetical protein
MKAVSIKYQYEKRTNQHELLGSQPQAHPSRIVIIRSSRISCFDGSRLDHFLLKTVATVLILVDI